MRCWTRSARGAADVKSLCAIGFALVGVSWAMVSVFSNGSDSSEQEPKVIASSLDDDGNIVDASYTKANSTKRIDSVQDEINDAISAQAMSALGEIPDVPHAPDGVQHAVLNAFIPVLSGDHDAFLEAIKAIGGEIAGDLEEEHPIFTYLSRVFTHAKVDVSRISVEPYEAPDRTAMRRRVVEQSEASEGASNIQTQVMELRPEGMFPNTPGKEDATALQVKIPVQPKGDKHEAVFSLILTYNAQDKLWQPATYQIIKNRIMEEQP